MNQDGLTVLEMTIVVAILGILASVAIPAWRDYMAREKVGYAADTAAPHRTALELACRDGRLDGASHETLRLDAPETWGSEYVTAIVAAGSGPTEGTVALTLGDVGGDVEVGARLVLEGTCEAGRMIWTASGEDIPDKYLPVLD